MARQAVAALGSLCFLAVAPGTVAGLLPFLVSGWEVRAPPHGPATGACMLTLRHIYLAQIHMEQTQRCLPRD